MTVPSLGIDLFIVVTSLLSRSSNDFAFPANSSLHHRYIFVIKIVQWLWLPWQLISLSSLHLHYQDRQMTAPSLAIDLFIIVTSSLSRSCNDCAFLAIDLFIIVTSSLLRSSNDCAFPDGYWSLLDRYILVIKIVEWLCLSWQLIFSTSLSPHYQDRTVTVPFLAIDIFLIVKSALSRSSNYCAFPRNWSIHHR